MFLRDVDGLVKWYNKVRPHMSLNLEIIETSRQAVPRDMPESGNIMGSKSGKMYHVSKEKEEVWSF